jgi:hypothetical protein
VNDYINHLMKQVGHLNERAGLLRERARGLTEEACYLEREARKLWITALVETLKRWLTRM